MRNILFLCNTYYQLIFAMHLRDCLYQDDYTIALISDHSKNADQICARLKKINHFDETHFIHSKDLEFSRENYKNGCSCVKNELKNIHVKVDALLYFNVSKATTLIFSELFKRNKFIEGVQFEEGVLSYNPNLEVKMPLTFNPYQNTLLYVFRKIFPQYNIHDKTTAFCCYYPELYNGRLDTIKIPPISSKSSIGDKIVDIFQAKSGSTTYEERYIFFTSVYDFEGGEAIGEFELVKAIADLVGKDNLLIKMHPRDTRTVYADEGFHIDMNSSIPFEALLFAYDFSDKVLLSATSGAILSAGLMLSYPPKMEYLYPLCKIEHNPFALGTVNQITTVLNNHILKEKLGRVGVCTNINELSNLGE